MSHAPIPLSRSGFLTALGVDLPAIEAGVPLETLVSFVEASGLRFADIYEVVIPARTLKHRKARQETLTVDESDKFARLVRVYDHAVQVFGNKEKALHWLNKPKQRFIERTPLEMVRTDLGGRMVEEMLGQIDYGFFA
jgi:putative toxin-antitoxin system antitoxin component (TIGR02293 family)